MDPRPHVPRASPPWLPRARGDGPAPEQPAPLMPPAPPRTRGWTALSGGRARAPGGSPAHAGMDLSLAPMSPASTGLPRARGDGPAVRAADDRAIWAPPRTRGWTGRGEPGSHALRGSPAHAGMDPFTATAVLFWTGLPRARGDGPAAFSTVCMTGEAPPRTRGWTFSSPCTARIPGGSPAHAGMDRHHGPAPSGAAWLPRARGDGPGTGATWGEAVAAPPRTRGWTRSGGPSPPAASGSPAHAGMDRQRDTAGPSGWGLPRARGDGPQVFDLALSQLTAPPRTRGWTGSPPFQNDAFPGSPAHAGMDRWPTLPTWPSSWLPRARGDGPGAHG